MRRTGFKNKPRKPLKRTPFKRSTKSHTKPKVKSKRKKAVSMRLLKNKLWNECKRLVRAYYSKHDGTFSCYTCGAYLDTPSKAQTGHFIPSSVCSVHMRYCLDNLRIQCYRCNINLSGNWIEFETRLNIEQGDGFTEKLKAENEATKNKQYDVLWYQNKIEEYKNAPLPF